MSNWRDEMEAWAERPLMYDREGTPIDLMEWGRLMRDDGYKRIAEDHLIVDGEPLWVSTVWLGLDHSFFAGPPLIFETMTFGHGDDADMQQRYPTEAAALAGHDRIVAELTDPAHRPRL